MQYYLGVDIGSLTTKVVLINKEENIIGWATKRSGYSGKDQALKLIDTLLNEKGIPKDKVIRTIATGYGRITFPADREVSEITCQAKGVSHLYNQARTIIDIGGQDSKVIKILPGGKVIDFAMNDKCAAGTGRFLEVMANALEVEIDDLGGLAGQAQGTCSISSFCTVFAESEVISHVAASASKQDIVKGVCHSVAERVASMTAGIGLEPELIFTGGVARNGGVAKALNNQLSTDIKIPDNPVITAALGAALIGIVS